jgi:hypothetical protein
MVDDGLLGSFEGRSCKTRQEATALARGSARLPEAEGAPGDKVGFEGARSIDYGSSTGKGG